MSGTGTLRGLKLSEPQGVHSALAPPSNLCVGLAILAVVLQLTISANLLLMVGIPYNSEGGNPLIKFHPATYLSFFALIVRLYGSGQPMRTLAQLLRESALVALFLTMFAICMVWVMASIGVSGVALYVESYFSAGVLYLALGDSSPRQRRMLAWIMMALFVLNAVLAVGETITRHTIIPVYLAHGLIFTDIAGEFRGQALYDHALTGGLMTEMALLLLVGMRMSPRLAVALGAALFLGLISFGGRTSLLFSSVALLGIGGYFMFRGLLDRTLRPGVIVAAIVGLVVASLLLWYVINETAIGIRLAGKLSFSDDSADSRSVQWLIFGLMSWNELLFGISVTQMVDYIYQLGLQYPILVIENFWLLAFMNLGAIGFVFYLTGFFAFLVGLWRRAPLFGRAILLTTIIVASTSNSLGRKSNVLFVMTAAVIATTGYARTRTALERVPASQATRRPGPSQQGANGLRPLALPPFADADEETFAPQSFAPQGFAPQSFAPQSFKPPGRAAPVVAGMGGLVRDPVPTDRALRPLRLTTARS